MSAKDEKKSNSSKERDKRAKLMKQLGLEIPELVKSAFTPGGGGRNRRYISYHTPPHLTSPPPPPPTPPLSTPRVVAVPRHPL